MINDLIISYSKGIVLFQRIPLSFSFSLSFFHIVTAFELIMTYRDDIRARLCAGLKAFSREIFARRAFKTNDSERREKGVFFSRRQGKQGIRVHFAPSPSRNRKEHGNCSTAL